MELNKTLAEIAITGIFEGMQVEAGHIIDALEDESISDLSRLSLRSLLLMSQENYLSAADLLEPWCTNTENQIDVPHAYYGLALWRSGSSEKSKHWCENLLKTCKDDTTRNLVNDVLVQIGA